jgi:hypothetical protein
VRNPIALIARRLENNGGGFKGPARREGGVRGSGERAGGSGVGGVEGRGLVGEEEFLSRRLQRCLLKM